MQEHERCPFAGSNSLDQNKPPLAVASELDSPEKKAPPFYSKIPVHVSTLVLPVPVTTPNSDVMSLAEEMDVDEEAEAMSGVEENTGCEEEEEDALGLGVTRSGNSGGGSSSQIPPTISPPAQADPQACPRSGTDP